MKTVEKLANRLGVLERLCSSDALTERSKDILAEKMHKLEVELDEVQKHDEAQEADAVAFRAKRKAEGHND